MLENRRAGFTLVELLVVIAIIGTLIALLLPAVQSAREASRRNTCLNSQRQLALAASQFEIRMGRLPGAFERLTIQGLDSTGGEMFATWAVMLMPDLERHKVYDAYSTGKVPGTYLDIMMCPSDDEKIRADAANSYVANAGGIGSTVNQLTSDGPFVNRAYDAKRAMLEGHWRDGREYTLAFSENLSAGRYDLLGWSGFKPGRQDTADERIDVKYVQDLADRQWSPVFVWHTSPPRSAYINGPDAICSGACKPEMATELAFSSSSGDDFVKTSATNARPTSNHTGGVNVAFASGRATFLRENIDYDVFRALMTPNDKKSTSPNPNIIIEDQPFL